MEKGQQDTKKRADIQKEPDYTRSRINICICVGNDGIGIIRKELVLKLMSLLCGTTKSVVFE